MSADVVMVFVIKSSNKFLLSFRTKVSLLIRVHELNELHIHWNTSYIIKNPKGAGITAQNVLRVQLN